MIPNEIHDLARCASWIALANAADGYFWSNTLIKYIKNNILQLD